jgi:signal transduction histidine kinase
MTPDQLDTFKKMLLDYRPRWRELAFLVIGYVGLDWASYIHPLHGLNITPWNPALALAVVFLMHFGKRAILPIIGAIILAETWVRGLPVNFFITLGLALMLTFGCWIVAAALHRFIPDSELFKDQRNLFIWAGVIAAGTLFNSCVFVVTLAFAGYVPFEGVEQAVFHYWVGDCAGVLITMPLISMLMDERHRSQLRRLVLRREFLADLTVTAVCLWIPFGWGGSAEFKYFYILFLPVAWGASRQGFPGAVVVAMLVQLGIIFAVHLGDLATVTVIEVQTLAVVIALFGFFIGVVVDEKQRISTELRQTLRLAAAGEMAGALAHELNQPLTALSTYGSACELLLKNGETGSRLHDAVQSMVRESIRASEVLRRLRDFFRTGATHLEVVELESVLAAALASFESRAVRDSVGLSLSAVPHVLVLGDRLQLEVVLRNLIANAFDVVAECPVDERRVEISVAREGGSVVCISIEDSGAGFDEKRLSRVFEGFHSTKSSGLGLGLIISKAIVEAHGGSLWAEAANHGIFRFSLPMEEG